MQPDPDASLVGFDPDREHSIACVLDETLKRSGQSDLTNGDGLQMNALAARQCGGRVLGVTRFADRGGTRTHQCQLSREESVLPLPPTRVEVQAKSVADSQYRAMLGLKSWQM